MHGRPRDFKNKLKEPRAAEAYKKKVDAIRQGTTLVLECRAARRYDAPVLEASAKLLKVVPEIYTVWNLRREALGPALLTGGAEGQAASDGELALTYACLMENPKSYSTWHHRKWVVSYGLASLEAEMRLVGKALELDPRNFHAWNYRRHIVARLGTSLQSELEYSEQLIGQDFSNYSAWHYRTMLLPKLHTLSATWPQAAELTGPASSAAPSTLFTGSARRHDPLPVEVLDEEYDMVHQAFATDSKDQSPWFYYRWLVGNSLSHLDDRKALSATSAPAMSKAGNVAPSRDAPAATAEHSSGSDAAHASEALAGFSLAGDEQSSSSSTFSNSSGIKHSAIHSTQTPTNAVASLQGQLPVDDTTRSTAAASNDGGRGGAHEEPAAGGAAAEVSQERSVEQQILARDVLKSVLAREVQRFEVDHLSEEPDAKWPLLMVARLKEAQARYGLCDGPTGSLLEEAKCIYSRLMVLDPLRRGYYQDALDGKAFVVVSALGTV